MPMFVGGRGCRNILKPFQKCRLGSIQLEIFGIHPTGSKSCDYKIELVPSSQILWLACVCGDLEESFGRPKILKLNVLTIRDVRKFFQLLEILNKTEASLVFSRLTFLLIFLCLVNFLFVHYWLPYFVCCSLLLLRCKHFLILVSQDWEQESTPIVAKGKEPKFIKPSDKFSSTEGENVFCFLEVHGDPIPTVTWFKVCWDFQVLFFIFSNPDVQRPQNRAEV